MGRQRKLMLLVFILGIIAGISVAVAIQLYNHKPLVIQKETKHIGRADYLSLNKMRTPALVYKRSLPGVVTVRAQFMSGATASVSQGSGFVIDKQGHVVTNMHVISRGKTIAPKVFVDFSNGAVVTATVIGSDPNADLSLLKIYKEPEVVLKPLPIGDSTLAKPGDPVIAIGSPFGETGSQSFGIVSSTHRSIKSLVGDFAISNAIQTDAAINQGNSGGPLLNLDGQVIGINTQIKTSQGGNEGVAYAVPSNLLTSLLPRLKKGGILEYPYLGISSIAITPQMARVLKLPVKEGLLVQSVGDRSPANNADIRSASTADDYYGMAIGMGGDIITAANGKKVTTVEELAGILSGLDPNSSIELKLIAVDGKTKTVLVDLVSRESLG